MPSLLSAWSKNKTKQQHTPQHEKKPRRRRLSPVIVPPTDGIRLQRIHRNDSSQSSSRSGDEENNNGKERCFSYFDGLNQEDNGADEDCFFTLSPRTCPAFDTPFSVEETTEQPQDNEQAAGADHKITLKIFVGTWNMAAKDPFSCSKGQYIGDTQAVKELEEFLPLGYDLYVLGTQEKVSKHLHTAVLARLNSVNKDASQQPTSTSNNLNRPRYMQMILTPTTPSSSALARQSSCLRSSSFQDERSTDHFFRTSSFGLVSSRTSHDSSIATSPSPRTFAPKFFKRGESGSSNNNNSCNSSSKHLDDGVKGRGDGAFLSRKSTSIAIYHATHLEDSLKLVRAGAHKFSFASGSKGGIAVMLQFANEQTITFANCHLEAKREGLRRRQLELLTTKLPAAMGIYRDETSYSDEVMDLAACSDHVVWMGDFNYRIHSLDGDSVLKLLSSNRHMELHDRYDSMQVDLAEVSGMQSFREALKWPTFYPTYKKIPNRPPLISTNDPNWPTKIYRVMYREPFYKGGKVKARVPGWCDRILYSSAGASSNSRDCFQVEKVAYTENFTTDNVKAHSASTPLRDNYRSVNDSLSGSDHSPVSCTFLWSVSHPNNQF